MRALEALGIGSEQYGVLLSPMVLSRLPQEIKLEFGRKDDNDGDINFLLDFLRKEIVRREKSLPTVHVTSECDSSMSASALFSNSQNHNTRKVCLLCDKSNHLIQNCYLLTKVNVHERKEVLKSRQCCFRCLTADKKHNFKKCRSKCKYCKGPHHFLLCEHENKRKQKQDVVLLWSTITTF